MWPCPSRSTSLHVSGEEPQPRRLVGRSREGLIPGRHRHVSSQDGHALSNQIQRRWLDYTTIEGGWCGGGGSPVHSLREWQRG